VFQNFTIFGSGGYVNINATKILNVGILELNCQALDSAFTLQCSQFSGESISLRGGSLGHITLKIGYLNLTGFLNWSDNVRTEVQADEINVSTITTAGLGQHKVTVNKLTIGSTMTQTVVTASGGNFTLEANEITAGGDMFLQGTQNMEACVSIKACRVFLSAHLIIGSGNTHTAGQLVIDFERTDANQIANAIDITGAGDGAEIHVKFGRLSHTSRLFTRLNNGGGLMHVHDTDLDTDDAIGGMEFNVQNPINDHSSQYLVENCTFQGGPQNDLSGGGGTGTWRFYNCNFYSAVAFPLIITGQATATQGIRLYAEGCLFRSVGLTPIRLSRSALNIGAADSVFFKSCHFEPPTGATLGVTVINVGNWTPESMCFSGCTTTSTSGVTAGAHLNVLYTLPVPGAASAAGAATNWEPPF
jgi:hypothetical protein